MPLDVTSPDPTVGASELLARDYGLLDRLTLADRARRPVEEKVAVAIALHEAMRTTRPGWPSESDRLADLREHQRVAELLWRARHVAAR